MKREVYKLTSKSNILDRRFNDLAELTKNLRKRYLDELCPGFSTFLQSVWSDKCIKQKYYFDTIVDIVSMVVHNPAELDKLGNLRLSVPVNRIKQIQDVIIRQPGQKGKRITIIKCKYGEFYLGRVLSNKYHDYYHAYIIKDEISQSYFLVFEPITG